MHKDSIMEHARMEEKCKAVTNLPQGFSQLKEIMAYSSVPQITVRFVFEQKHSVQKSKKYKTNSLTSFKD